MPAVLNSETPFAASGGQSVTDEENINQTKQMTHTHTPGPWSHQMNKDNSLDFFGDDGSKVIACNIRLMNQINNARLIAAAPEMLEALLLLVDQYDSSGDFTMGGNLTNEPFLKARAAIAKATGRGDA